MSKTIESSTTSDTEHTIPVPAELIKDFTPAELLTLETRIAEAAHNIAKSIQDRDPRSVVPVPVSGHAFWCEQLDQHPPIDCNSASQEIISSISTVKYVTYASEEEVAAAVKLCVLRERAGDGMSHVVLVALGALERDEKALAYFTVAQTRAMVAVLQLLLEYAETDAVLARAASEAVAV